MTLDQPEAQHGETNGPPSRRPGYRRARLRRQVDFVSCEQLPLSFNPPERTPEPVRLVHTRGGCIKEKSTEQQIVRPTIQDPGGMTISAVRFSDVGPGSD